MEITSGKKGSHFSSFWQIWLPFSITAMFVLALVVLVVLGAFNKSDLIHIGANIALSFLALIGLLILLIVSLITIASIIGLSRLTKKAPGFFEKAQQTIRRVSNVIIIIAKIIIAPFELIKRFRMIFTPHQNKEV